MEEEKKITVSDEALRRAAGEGMDEFLRVFTDRYLEVTGGQINSETMPLLNGDLEQERDEDEFMAMYEQYEEFDDLEEQFMDMEEEVTEQVARYVDEHLDQFAEISA